MNPIVAVIGAGTMGSGVGQRLVERGLKVVTALAGRSEASVQRARAAGMISVADQQIVDADLILSIVPPGDAVAVAQRFAPLLNGKAAVYVDCNAVSPETAMGIGKIIAASGCAYVDIGIIGGPPRPDGYGPALYACGPQASRLAVLTAHGLDLRVLDGPIGAASALKMSYAGITKGFTAVGAAMMLAASRAGAADALYQELAASQPALLAWLSRQMPRMYGKAYRWVAEMEEIAQFARAHARTAEIYQGVARFYDSMAQDFAGPKKHAATLTAFVKGPARNAAE
jgi:3-hydroxyisobutyrate dehydrogenase-like beta-hydroxyacid dehydrogenase